MNATKDYQEHSHIFWSKIIRMYISLVKVKRSFGLEVEHKQVMDTNNARGVGTCRKFKLCGIRNTVPQSEGH